MTATFAVGMFATVFILKAGWFLQICGTFNDVSAATVFDVLNDPIYRKKWDFNMIEGYEICQISPNNDIGYYASRS